MSNNKLSKIEDRSVDILVMLSREKWSMDDRLGILGNAFSALFIEMPLSNKEIVFIFDKLAMAILEEKNLIKQHG